MSTRPLVITFQRKIYMQIEEVTELIGDDEVSLYLFINDNKGRDSPLFVAGLDRIQRVLSV